MFVAPLEANDLVVAERRRGAVDVEGKLADVSGETEFRDELPEVPDLIIFIDSLVSSQNLPLSGHDQAQQHQFRQLSLFFPCVQTLEVF